MTTVGTLKKGDKYVLRKRDVPSWRTVKNVVRLGDRVRIDHDNNTWFGWHNVKRSKRCYVPL